MREGQYLSLRPKRFLLLLLFLAHLSEILGKEYLLEQSWGGTVREPTLFQFP